MAARTMSYPKIDLVGTLNGVRMTVKTYVSAESDHIGARVSLGSGDEMIVRIDLLEYPPSLQDVLGSISKSIRELSEMTAEDIAKLKA